MACGRSASGHAGHASWQIRAVTACVAPGPGKEGSPAEPGLPPGGITARQQGITRRPGGQRRRFRCMATTGSRPDHPSSPAFSSPSSSPAKGHESGADATPPQSTFQSSIDRGRASLRQAPPTQLASDRGPPLPGPPGLPACPATSSSPPANSRSKQGGQAHVPTAASVARA